MPFIPYDDWWIRGFDYPRAQMIVVLGLAATCWIVSHDNREWVNFFVAVLLVSAAVYQTYRILPYTRLWQHQVGNARQPTDESRQLRLLVSNVLQTNTEYQKLVDLVDRIEPDILLTVETNARWEEALKREIGDSYPYGVDVPLENMYGMHLFSKIELINPTIKYRIKDDIPSIDCQIRLGNGELIDLYFLHPMPPSPSEDYASTGRDAELAMVGLEVRDKGNPAIVAGDMNDVAWSHSSRLFQRLSGLVDPRRGRGLFATFHADYWFLRWPLDHVYHSEVFSVAHLERLPSIGSDHFPVYIQLSFEPEHDDGQGKKPKGDDKEEARKVIKNGKKGVDDTVLDSDRR